MVESILVAVVTGALTLAGVILSNNARQAVADQKIEELTREVREHNNFARRMPVVEEQIKVINHRLSDLESPYAAPPLRDLASPLRGLENVDK